MNWTFDILTQIARIAQLKNYTISIDHGIEIYYTLGPGHLRKLLTLLPSTGMSTEPQTPWIKDESKILARLEDIK